MPEGSGSPPAITGSRMLETTGRLNGPLDRKKLELDNCKQKLSQILLRIPVATDHKTCVGFERFPQSVSCESVIVLNSDS